MNAKECGEFIAALRKESQLTQKQLAERLNVSDKAVSRWETGKGYPDVSSLAALSEIFGVTVNELLAGKRIENDIAQIADDNIISVFKETEKNKKKQNIRFVLYCAVLLIILLPVLLSIIKEFSSIAALTQVSSENIISSIVMGVVAVCLFVSGLVIRKGNVTLIHSYHYKKVTDLDGYSRAMGNTLMVMSIPIIVGSAMILFAHIKIIEILCAVFLFCGIIPCIIYLFKIQVKYNGGLF